jgi:hypothetical protein
MKHQYTMSSASSSVASIGERTYLKTADNFGIITRPNFLGLKSLSPVIQLDDGSLVAYAGEPALQEIIPVSTGKNYSDESVSIPLDVKTVGTEQLTSAGIDPAVQTKMFENFIKLDKSKREEYSQKWIAAASASPADQQKFIQAMVAALS